MTDAAADPATDFCSRCGADLDPTAAAFSGDGLVCKACENVEYAREHRPGFGAELGALGWGALSLVCNPFFVMSFVAVTKGWAELSEARAYDAQGKTPPDPSMAVKAVLGMALGAFYPVIFVSMLGLLLVTSLLGAALRPEPADDPVYAGGYDPYAPPAYEPPRYDPPPSAPPAYDPPSPGVVLRSDAPPIEPEPSTPRAELTADRPVRAQLAEHARRARSLGLTPYLYAHADWCGPCRAVEGSREDPRMRAAFAGVYLIGADVDTIDDAALGREGIHIRGIPAWYGLDARGRYDERSITGAAWGADTPANMAPVLGAFFSPSEI